MLATWRSSSRLVINMEEVRIRMEMAMAGIQATMEVGHLMISVKASRSPRFLTDLVVMMHHWFQDPILIMAPMQLRISM